MIIGEVVGNVWATRKDEKLNGLKLLIVKPIKLYENENSSSIIAVDNVGAGVGDQVLVVSGSSARVSVGGNDIPVDAVIVGIIDSIEK
jgi:ethanolamine utilization protein EutN